MTELKKEGPTRTFHVYETEVLDFVTYLVARSQNGTRTTKNFDDRKRMRSVLKQLGGYEMYMKLTDKTGVGLSVAELTKGPRVVEMTLESIDYLLSLTSEVAIGEAMRVCELEERVTNAKVGIYAYPSEVADLLPPPSN